MEPKFAASAVTTEEELADAGRQTLTEYLNNVSLDRLRHAVHEGFGQSSSDDDLVTGEIHLDEETPQNVMVTILYAGGIASLVMTIAPEQFDRTDNEQEALYQKVLGMIRIYAEAPVNPERKQDSVFVGPFQYLGCPEQDNVDQWKGLLERWMAHGT